MEAHDVLTIFVVVPDDTELVRRSCLIFDPLTGGELTQNLLFVCIQSSITHTQSCFLRNAWSAISQTEIEKHFLGYERMAVLHVASDIVDQSSRESVELFKNFESSC